MSEANIDKIRIGPSPFGKGVFASREIHKGEAIFRFSGSTMTFAQVLKKGSKSMNALQIGRGIYMDLEPPGVLVNHSCNPNAGVTKYLELVAVTNITEGAEVFYDYSTVMNEHFETMNCDCRQTNCRKIIGDFGNLPIEIQSRYIRTELVPTFILDEFHGAKTGGLPQWT